MEPHRVATGELDRELSDQLAFLLSSAAAYDEGAIREAKRLAVQLRILLVDSLLDKLRLRSRLALYDTAHRFQPENAFPHYGLVKIRYDDVPPVLDPESPSDATFSSWAAWSQAIVLSDGRGNTFTRLGLLKTVANKRGAHVALDLPPVYVAFTKPGAQGYKRTGDAIAFTFGGSITGPPDGSSLLPSPVPPSIRQLVHEILVSLAIAHPDKFPNADVAASIALRRRHSPMGLRGAFLSKHSALAKRGPLSLMVNRAVRAADGQTLG